MMYSAKSELGQPPFRNGGGLSPAHPSRLGTVLHEGLPPSKRGSPAGPPADPSNLPSYGHFSAVGIASALATRLQRLGRLLRPTPHVPFAIPDSYWYMRTRAPPTDCRAPVSKFKATVPAGSCSPGGPRRFTPVWWRVPGTRAHVRAVRWTGAAAVPRVHPTTTINKDRTIHLEENYGSRQASCHYRARAHHRRPCGHCRQPGHHDVLDAGHDAGRGHDNRVHQLAGATDHLRRPVRVGR